MKRREILVARVAAVVGLVACAGACRPPSSAPIAPAASKPAPTTQQADRTPVATESSPARHVGARAKGEQCPMHLRGPTRHDSVDEWLGWSARLLHLCQGEPDVRSEKRWIYNLPQGCSEERSEITVVFDKGVVISTKVQTRHTGEHCESF